MYIDNETIEKIIKILKRLNFSSDEIKSMIKKYNSFKDDIDILEENYLEYKKSMEEKGYSEEELKKLAILKPRVIFYKNNEVNFLNCYIRRYMDKSKENRKDNKSIKETDYRYDEIIEILVKLGYSSKKIKDLFDRNSCIIFSDPLKLQEVIDFYIENGLSKEDIKKITKDRISILKYEKSDFDELLDVAKYFDIDMKYICELIRKTTWGYNFDLQKEIVIFKWFRNSKINKDKFKKKYKTTMRYLYNKVDCLDEQFNNFIKLGFTEEEIYKILEENLTTFSFSYEMLEEKMEILKEYDLSLEEQIKFICGNPSYFTISSKNIREKLDAAYQLGVLKYLIQKPKNLIQGVELTLARGYYLQKYDLTDSVYASLIYTSEKVFKKRFGVNNAYVLGLYKKAFVVKKVLDRQEV